MTRMTGPDSAVMCTLINTHTHIDILQEVVFGATAELMKALVPMEDAQASFQMLRLSTASCLSHLLCIIPPSITHQTAADYDAVVEWAWRLLWLATELPWQGYQARRK